MFSPNFFEYTNIGLTSSDYGDLKKLYEETQSPIVAKLIKKFDEVAQYKAELFATNPMFDRTSGLERNINYTD
jgi:hypothetical protein